MCILKDRPTGHLVLLLERQLSLAQFTSTCELGCASSLNLLFINKNRGWSHHLSWHIRKFLGHIHWKLRPNRRGTSLAWVKVTSCLHQGSTLTLSWKHGVCSNMIKGMGGLNSCSSFLRFNLGDKLFLVKLTDLLPFIQSIIKALKSLELGKNSLV